MRRYEYTESPKALLQPDIVQQLLTLHESKGRQQLFIESSRDELTTLLEIAKIQSVSASNRIEGIHTTDKRLAELVQEKTDPHNRSEEEIAGYREVLSLIHERYDYISPTPNVVLQLHKELYSYSNANPGGVFKASDNLIAETGQDGIEKIRFKPVSAFETPLAMDELCASFSAAWKSGVYDKLLLIPMFILDFLCIHPFDDGNGRMSRLLSLLLYYRADYIVGKYISVEMLIEKSKETYYEALESSSANWHAGTNDYAPFVRYYLGVLIKAYREFETRIAYMTDKTLSKPDRIRTELANSLVPLSKKELLERNPDISEGTVERALAELVKSGTIQKIGAGKKTEYVFVR